ncbi:hydroxyacid dehydrogenase [Sphingobacteriaceae bacterium]|nr:hydroxyacid dehydrogenase [Sphingobacteriaceae bacterium]
MKTAVYSIHEFENEHLLSANDGKHELIFIPQTLTEATVNLAKGCEAISVFVSDDLKAENLMELQRLGVKYITLRSAGYNHVDMNTAHNLNIAVARVPAYSPYSVAEHAITLMLALNRRIVQANNNTHRLNFSLNGLVGFDMKGKTVGIIGTGKIGSVVSNILYGFGCRMLAFDNVKNSSLAENYNVEYTSLEKLCCESDIITLHLPLTKETEHIVNATRIKMMKQGVMLINTSRGKLIDTNEVVSALKSGHIGYFGMDVYEDESLFFQDHSPEVLKDDVLARLMTFSNVIVTGHQAFLTQEALANIAVTTIHNLDCFEHKKQCVNLIL